MALFFDQDWFAARLADRGLTRTVLAAAAGMTEAELAQVWKDQRELSAREVGILAELLGETPAEVANRAGVSTPTPGGDPMARIAALERQVAELQGRLARLERSSR
jgi:transcriptional regulator with XRE-family HTH domain